MFWWPSCLFPAFGQNHLSCLTSSCGTPLVSAGIGGQENWARASRSHPQYGQWLWMDLWIPREFGEWSNLKFWNGLLSFVGYYGCIGLFSCLILLGRWNQREPFTTTCGTLHGGVRTEVLPPGWRMEWVKRKKNERVIVWVVSQNPGSYGETQNSWDVWGKKTDRNMIDLTCLLFTPILLPDSRKIDVNSTDLVYPLVI